MLRRNILALGAKRLRRHSRKPVRCSEPVHACRTLKSPFFDDLHGLQVGPIVEDPGDVAPTMDAKYSVPVSSLFTGARSNEILQLYVDDAVEKRGVTCLSVNAVGDGKKHRTAAISAHSLKISSGVYSRLVSTGQGKAFTASGINSKTSIVQAG